MARFGCTALLLMVSGFAMSQHTEVSPNSYDVTCSYQLTFLPDSTIANSKTELFLLFFNQEHSLFKSKNRYLSDSAIAATGRSNNRQELMTFLQAHRTDFHFNIVKRGCNEVSTTDQVYHTQFTYPEASGHLQWALTQDTATIAGYLVQRATTEFGGRKWEAWFTEAVPVSEGPYKFCGLPGLIVRLTDSKKQYDFFLNGLTQLRRELTDQIPESVKTDKSTFIKKRKQYRANPIGVAEQSGVVFTSGRSEIVQRMQQNMKSDNNPIEFLTN